LHDHFKDENEDNNGFWGAAAAEAFIESGSEAEGLGHVDGRIHQPGSLEGEIHLFHLWSIRDDKALSAAGVCIHRTGAAK
jgi:hypothetical protein